MACVLRSAIILTLLPFFTQSSALPTNHISTTLNGRSPAISAPLSLMCVGDSITVGVGDGLDDHNGYRLDLYNMLTVAGMKPQFMGNQSNGNNNPQPRHEGFGYNRIDQIMGHMQSDSSMSAQPDLVLIHAGTNDNDLETTNETYITAPDRLGTLIDFVILNNPAAVVLVAKLVQNTYNSTQTAYFNSRVPDVVQQRLQKGHKVQVVDMSTVAGTELSDMLHPDSLGYADMANRWFRAIMAIPDGWWAPNATNITGQSMSSASAPSFAALSTSALPSTSAIATITTASSVPAISASMSVLNPGFTSTAQASSQAPASTSQASPSASTAPSSAASSVFNRSNLILLLVTQLAIFIIYQAG